jgi:TonB family protein
MIASGIMFKGKHLTSRLGWLVARVCLMPLMCFAFGFGGSSFAQTDFSALAQHVGKSLYDAHIHTTIIGDFVGEEDGANLQGVLLADRLWFALLASQKGFQTLNRNLLRGNLYSQHSRGVSFRTAELEAARAAGAEVLIAGKIEQQKKALRLIVTSLNVSNGKKLDETEISVSRTQSLDRLARQVIRPSGPVYLVGQNGVSAPECVYCPLPEYSDKARQKKLQGTVVVTAIIGRSGRAQEVGEIRGLSDGLTEQAIKVVRQWQFKPAQDLNGKSVAIMVPVDVTFHLP